MVSVPMAYLGNGDVLSALSWVFNDYIGGGIIWTFFALIVFYAVYSKTQDLSVSGIVFIVFCAMVATFVSKTIQTYFLLLAGAMVVILFIKIFFKR